MSKLKITRIVVAVLIAIVALDFAGSSYGVWKFGFFGPLYESARRDIFEQSRAFNEGMQQELQQMRLDYVRGDTATRDALRSVILHRTAAYDLDAIRDPDLRSFIAGLRVNP